MSGDSLYLEHYQEAKRILSEPSFEDQELIVHDYAGHRLLGYVDDIVREVTHVPSYYTYAYVLNDELKQSNNYSWNIKPNNRYSVIRFGDVKKQFMVFLDRKIEDAEKEYQNYLAKRKTPQEITIPLVFDGVDYLLVRYDDNYADEFDVDGFRIFTVEEWETWQNRVPKKRIHAGFGTNEACEYRNKKEFLDCFKAVPLTAEQAKTMFEIFGRKATKFLDYNGRSYDTVIHYNMVDYGMFPHHVGDKDHDPVDDGLEDPDENDEEFDDEE